MSYSAVPTVSGGDSWSASQHNTYLKDNLAALFPYTTAGDMAYATSSSALSRLAIGAAYKVLRTNAGGTAPEWSQSPFVVASLYDATGYSYASTVRDMPNSSGTITPLVTSTVIVAAQAEAYCGVGNCWFQYRVRCNGVDSSNYSDLHYSNEVKVSVPHFAIFTGVTAGAKTILLRELQGYGGAVSYTVTSKRWIAIAIPE